MNINTLSTEDTEYRLGDLPIALYPNYMKKALDGSETYFGRPIIRGKIGMEDIANDIVAANITKEYNKRQILEVWRFVNNAMSDRLFNGYMVDAGIGVYCTRVTGEFLSENDSFKKERNSIDLSFRPSAVIKTLLRTLTPVIRQGNAGRPQITGVEDARSHGQNILTRGGFLNITGSHIAVRGTDERVGLYFDNRDDPEKSVMLTENDLGINTASHIACVIPQNLAAGSYQIRVVTQFARGHALRREPMAHTFPATFTVGAEA